MKTKLLVGLGVSTSLLSACGSKQQEEVKQPNVIFIVADD